MTFEQERESDKLELILDSRLEYSDLVEYQLYEANFATGLKFIFRRMLEKKRESRCKEESNWMTQNDNSNILAFIGGRGAGKTTSMKGFCRILENLDGCRSDSGKKTRWLRNVLEDEDDINLLKTSSVKFHILKMVDAGLLNESEDLLELILVSLYEEYTNRLDRNSAFSKGYQSVMMEIEEIFEELLAMYNSTRKKSADNEDYTLATLARMTGNSALIREKISELLSKMCALQKKNEDSALEYYVIPIDDLDLNLKHGYEMIEQLQKYFSDERIFILLTMDYEQLCDVCIEHFHQEMEYTDSFYGKNVRSRSQILATDMMTKVFPLDQRIFLPDSQKQGKQIRVVINKEPLETLPVKQYIMKMVARRMHIYYDARGTKRHFIEPDTVRQLVFYNNFLNSLYHIQYSEMKTWAQINRMKDGREKETCIEFNRKQMTEYTHNHHRFNDDIAKRQAQVMLTISQRQAFKTFLEFDVSRRAMYFEKADRNDRGIVFADVPMEERNQYAYSDLIQKLYLWGRTHYEDKPFISCVLSSFSSEMVREYINYRYNPDEDKRKLSKERLVKFMGRTFGNEWIGSSMRMEKESVDNITEFRFYSEDLSELTMMAESTYRRQIASDYNQARTQSTRKSQEGKMEDERISGKKVPEASADDRVTIGYRAQAVMEDIVISFSLDRLKDEIDRSVESMNKTSSNPKRTQSVRKKCISDWLDEEKVIQILECLDMFLIQSSAPEGTTSIYEGADIVCIESTQYTSDQARLMEVRFKGDCMMDIFGFIPKSFDYLSVRKSVDQRIIKALASCLCPFLSKTDLRVSPESLKREIEGIVNSNSIFSKIDKEPIRNEIAFPFYDLDLSYNVIKRYRERMANVVSYDLYDHLLCIFDTLQGLLEEEGREYGNTDYCYDKIFQKCVYMEAFRSFKNNEKAKRCISSFLNNLSGWEVDLYEPDLPLD